MNKTEKTELIRKCRDTGDIIRIISRLQGADNCLYYPQDVNEKMFLGQREKDFSLDGYDIIKFSQIKKVEMQDGLHRTINAWKGTAEQVSPPDVDISSWQTVFRSLSRLEGLIIIQDEVAEQFAMGRVRKAYKTHLIFDNVDGWGEWQDPLEIPYPTVTRVSWATKYARTWYEYLKKTGKEKSEI